MDLLSNIYNIITNPNFYVPVIIVILLIIIGNFYKGIKQKFKAVLFTFKDIEIDWWSISHIFLYIYFGYQFPNNFTEFLIIGSLWELFENLFCKESFEKIVNCYDSDNFICRNIKIINGCDYWYGKLDDVAMNMIGFVIGAALAKKFKQQ